MNKGTSVFTNGLIWFGAAISVAEIEAGIQSGNQWFALILGHILGGFMLFAVGFIGAKCKKNAMEMTEDYFGRFGSKFFASLNLLQLIGWTSVMIAQGSFALKNLDIPINFNITCIILAILVAVWIFIGLRNSSYFAILGVLLLTLLVIILTYKLFTFSSLDLLQNNLDTSFWKSFELSIAMPLSWLPLISDYTKNAFRPFASTFVSSFVYTIISIWMYVIGILIAKAYSSGIILEATLSSAVSFLNIGIASIFIIVFSTITTTFLDAYSAGESAKAILKKLNPKIFGVITCAIGGICAIMGIFEKFSEFLYFIASVFAPLASVLITSYYFVMNSLKSKKLLIVNIKLFYLWNLFSWLMGFITYQISTDFVIGSSLSAILVSIIFTSFGKLLIKKVES